MFEFQINQQAIKLSNRTRILNFIAEKGEMTKQEIAKQLNLSIPTVISNISKLLEEGLVKEAGVAESTGGRKPVIIRFNPNARYSFGVDISPRKMKIVLINLESEILVEEEIALKEKINSFEAIIKESKKIIETIIEKEKIKKENILGVGFSLPGIINEEALILENAPNLKVKNFDFKPYKEIFGMPIYIENEANAAAIGERTLGHGKGKNNLVYISITEGVGTGIIIQNYLYKSISKKAGEFGHMRVTDEKIKCNCGRTGCWELYASERALIERFNTFSKQRIESVTQFFEYFQEGNEVAIKVLDRYLDYLCIGIENIILALSPEYIIIGGEISKYEGVYKEKLIEKLGKESTFYGMQGIRIGFSQLKEKASLLGAGILAIQDLFNMNNKAI
ncbi:ROK family transcriptional regulator [Crassaminicella profunda]|uniref:ROK family transcriptional regulator n=1 Tax=Crassaminicella profunda TaxID=1286698 RepID=UPI001CA66886|nr:ROK family transcriptional regulator [Crassaminicella profunda]QZY54456.1 ROK family transcriptional regulator [Crassaminicella profunda]